MKTAEKKKHQEKPQTLFISMQGQIFTSYICDLKIPNMKQVAAAVWAWNNRKLSQSGFS